MTLTNLCKDLRNWFVVDRHFGEYEISSGELTIPYLQNGQFFCIRGSVFNDGVHRYPADDLIDEKFNGAIWSMALPKEVIDLCDAISKWENDNASVLASPYQSESFGGYSYSKASGGNSNGSGVVTYKSQFANELNKWRKI